MVELFVIKLLIGNVLLFLFCLGFVSFLHHFINFHHVIRKSVNLFLLVTAAEWIIKLIGSWEKLYWMVKTVRFFI